MLVSEVVVAALPPNALTLYGRRNCRTYHPIDKPSGNLKMRLRDVRKCLTTDHGFGR